ncbi:MAG: hypothetical protein IH624_16975 [Phycisphaerae bacterium]|nr:hypothetical protein [Phycisphaerae bacterium]
MEKKEKSQFEKSCASPPLSNSLFHTAAAGEKKVIPAVTAVSWLPG